MDLWGPMRVESTNGKRVYSQRTKKIMKTMNVTFNELSAMAFEQHGLKPWLQGMTSRQITPRTAHPALANQNLLTPNASTTVKESALIPTNSSSQSPNISNTSQDVDELSPQQHLQKQDNHAPLQHETVADNVHNAMFDGNVFKNPFTPLSQVLLNHLLKCGFTEHAYVLSTILYHPVFSDFVMSDLDHSTVTYTSISSDYEEPSDVGSQGVVVYGYDGLPIHLDDKDHEDDPADYPADRDDDEEEESFRGDVDDEDEDEGEDEDEEEEHLASVDFVLPPTYCTTIPSLPFLIPLPPTTNPTYTMTPLGYRAPMIWLRTSLPPPLPLSSPLPLPPPIILPRNMASMVMMRAAAPSTYCLAPPSGIPPLLPIPLSTSSPPLLLPSTDCRADILDVMLSPQKRLCIAPGLRYEIGESSSAPTTSSTGGFRADYDPDEITEEIPVTDVAELDRRSLACMARLMESEARASRVAWVQSMDASDMARSKVRALKTTVLAQQTEIEDLRVTDHKRQA
nr:hypothetical protein [Tanacetum cinerariifolium]